MADRKETWNIKTDKEKQESDPNYNIGPMHICSANASTFPLASLNDAGHGPKVPLNSYQRGSKKTGTGSIDYKGPWIKYFIRRMLNKNITVMLHISFPIVVVKDF